MGRLTQSDFANIVNEVTTGMSMVRNASTTGFHVEVEFASRSGKQSLYAGLGFDGDTGRCTTIRCSTPGATQPLTIANAIEREIAARH